MLSSFSQPTLSRVQRLFSQSFSLLLAVIVISTATIALAQEQLPAELPPAELPPAELPPAEQPPTEQPPTEQPPTEQPPTEQPPTEQPPTEQPPTEQPPAEQPPAELPPAEQPPAEQPPQPPKPQRIPHVGSITSPLLPGQPWRVHDQFRPRPRRVEPPATEVIVPPPGDAVVLFSGDSLSEWAHRDHEEEGALYEAQWAIRDGYFEVARGHGDLYSLENFGSVQLHMEWSCPEGVSGSSQGKGNSGIKFLGLYEVQILDSYQNRTYADGQAAAIYGQYPPDVNASRPAGQWQSYDIVFEIPKFEGDTLISPGYLTVFHNGVLVHHRRELVGVTGMRSPGKYQPHPPAGPIMLQDHGAPVRFRNIWVRPLDR